ncbi:glycosyltransferase family 1 protein [Leptospira sp. 96542]|nr:glycosyltransferase family 1 protein [Leptospira sp. 96542]
MKIGIDVRPLAYGITGNSRYLAEVLELLLPKHPNVEFYFYSNKSIHPVFSHLVQENVKLRIETRPIPGPIYLNFVLPRKLKNDKIEKFWATLQMLPFFKLKIPSYVNYHDLNFISAPDTMARSNFFQHKLLSPKTIKNADVIFCLSKNTKNEISHFFPEASNKCLVVYPGVKQSKPVKKNFLFPKHFFLTVGTLEPRKNIKRLVDAYKIFKTENPKDPHDLYILGRKGWGEEGESLYQSLMEEENKNLGIHFLENPNDDILGQAFKECKAFFFPSHHEGFGLPLLEAMIENKRCAASDIPVFKEILSERCDLFISSQNTEQWTNAFRTMAKVRPNRLPKFDNKFWSWQTTMKQIEGVIFG